MPFATFQLASLVWTMVNRELTTLLDDVIKADGHQGQPRVAPVLAPLPPTEPTPAPANGGLTVGEMLTWREAADRLRNRITREIEERDGLPPSKAIQNQLAQYRTYHGMAERLIAELREDTPPETLAELDRLGRLVCGATWPDLPMPGTSGNGQR
jgi:hypothetical protein